MTSTTSAAPQLRTSSVTWFALNAVVAWTGLAVQFVISATGMYPVTQTVLSQFGPGNAGAVGRIVDFLSYFTIWSNLVVAIVLTLLARDPLRDTPVFRVLRLDSLLMISITGIVYAVILAPGSNLRGWENVANAFIHIATPILTIVVWFVAGPRGWIRFTTVLAALILPMVYLAYTLLRGAVIGAYPYGFVDVVTKGYGTVLVNSIAITFFGVMIGLVFLGIDRLLTRRAR